MDAKEGRHVLADHDGWLHSMSEGLWVVPKVWRCTTNVSQYIMKPWSFRGWGLDLVGEVHPLSSKGHRFFLVTTDYFMKWTEAVPLKNMTHKEVIIFVLEYIVHRFGIPQPLMIDQGGDFYATSVQGVHWILEDKVVEFVVVLIKQQDSDQVNQEKGRRKPEVVARGTIRSIMGS
jgi:hypothetical protein